MRVEVGGDYDLPRRLCNPAQGLGHFREVPKALSGRRLADIAISTGVNLCPVWGRALILGAVISLVASGCMLGSTEVTTDTRAPQPLSQLHAQCGDRTGPVYKLGGALPGTLLGNSKPVRILVSVGEQFAVSASFTNSQLVAFTITPPRLLALCHVYTTGDGGGPASIFEARTVGHFVIQTDDGSNSCRSCAIFGFEADVTVIRHSNK
jgi:hypothetical protein